MPAALIRLPAHMGEGRGRGYQTIHKTTADCGHTVTRIHVMSAASYDSAHMGEGVEYHTVYGVSPCITRTYLLPYSGTGMLYRTVS